MDSLHELISCTPCTCATDGVECLDGSTRCLRCRANAALQALLYQRTRGWVALGIFKSILETLKEELICEGEPAKRLDWLLGLARDSNLHTKPPPDPKATPKKPRIRPVLAWYDAWVGIYYNKTKHRLYVLPVPFCGVSIDLPKLDPMGALRKLDRALEPPEWDNPYEGLTID